MIVDMGQNRSYHNNWSPYINQKRAIVKLKCKSYASKIIMAKKEKKQAEIIIDMIYLLLV